MTFVTIKDADLRTVAAKIGVWTERIGLRIGAVDFTCTIRITICTSHCSATAHLSLSSAIILRLFISAVAER